MKLTRRKLATLLTVTAAAAHAEPQAPAAPASAPDDMTAARAALKSSLDTLSKAKVPIALEPATHFKA